MGRAVVLVFAIACGAANHETRPPAANLADRFLACHDRLLTAGWASFATSCLDAHAVAGLVDGTPAGDPSATFASLKDAFPDLRVAPQLVLVAGRDVFAESLVTGTHATAHLPIGIRVVEHVVFDAADRITLDEIYADPSGAMAQLGEGPPRRPAEHDARASGPAITIASGNPTERANERVVADFVHAVNAHDAAAVVAFLGTDPVDSDAGIPVDIRGADVAKFYTDVLSSIPDYHREIAHLYAAGDHVVELGIKTGTWGTSPVRLHFLEVLDLRDGKLAAIRRYYNVAAMAAQMQ